tara:strand:- start:496 stop:729 length:234 start_codon:yes stop_codon:yes gene_type:complete
MKLISSVILTQSEELPLKDYNTGTTIGDLVNDRIANLLYKRDSPIEEPGIDTVEGIKSITVEFDEADAKTLMDTLNR